MSAAGSLSRVARRALQSARRAPIAGTSRERLAAALACCSETERLVLALLIEERLTPAETANALDLPLAIVIRTQSTLFTELRRALRGRPFRRALRTAAASSRLGRAS
jgi:DNA-directed RNA polymerase specialized sigma24 family protein